MLDIGWSELLVVAVVAVVVVGPKDLPKLMRTLGFYAGKVRRTAADFQRQFKEAMSESEADEVRKNIEAISANMGTAADFVAPVDKPLMTPMAEPARTALGAPPLGTREVEPQATAKPKRTKAKGARAKEAPSEGAPAKRAKPAKAATVAKRAKPAKSAGGAKSAGATKATSAKPRKSNAARGPAPRTRGKRTAGPKP